MGLADHPPRRALRLALRAPILVYRAGLGWVFGHRLVYLAHRGRASGLRREAVLEVVRYDPATGEVVVASGWGEGAQWYRNLRASPALEVRIGRHRYVALEQRFLTVDETAAVLEEYIDAHPHAARVLARVMGWPLGGTPGQRRAFAHSLPAVAFRPSARAALRGASRSRPALTREGVPGRAGHAEERHDGA